METAAKPIESSRFLAFCFGFGYRALNLTRATTLLQVTTIDTWKLLQVNEVCSEGCHKACEASILSPAIPAIMGYS